jgi:putative ABC transport system substrate-binding protein
VFLNLGEKALRRRDFITGMVGSLAVWPLTAPAQHAGKLPTIGFLGSGTPATQDQWVAAFVRRLRELGWIDGHNVGSEYRWAEGRTERFAEIAAEFVAMKVDVIVTWGTEPVLAAKKATSVIPIVSAVMGDPVGNRIVASLARPGGNITGLSIQSSDLAGKRLELLREVVAGLRRLAILANVANASSISEMGEVVAAARALGLDVATREIRLPEDIAPAIQSLKGQADALYVPGDPLFTTHRLRINTLSLGARLPTMHTNRQYVVAAGLMSYGPNFPDLFRRAADHVDKILRGAIPDDIPVEQPTKFDLVINLTTAKALDLEIAPMLLARANEVIE